jgi:hypothetical protein
VLVTNVVINQFDAWVLGQPWARTDVGSWSRNLRLGWEWDEDEFITNMFAHPFHGAAYFNAGRANGLSYWESAPLAFLGSWTWEYFGERFRPSLNDFFNTSFGGMAMGEMFHRVATTIRDSETGGFDRTAREITATLLDPIGGLNRLVRGEWRRRRPNPVEHDSSAYVFRFHAGSRFAGEAGALERTAASPTVLMDMTSGAPFDRPFETAYDFFSLRMQVSPSGGINMVHGLGRLYGRDLRRPGARTRHLFAVNQRYDYVNNAAYKFSAQGIETAIWSRWRLGSGAFSLRSGVAADVIVMGAIDAPSAGTATRPYDFGPGFGLMLDLGLTHRGVTYLSWYSRAEYLHSVSGASADHYVGFAGLELTVPVARRWGIGAYVSSYDRTSQYSDQPDERRVFPEFRLFVTWTSTYRPGAVLSR